MLEMHGDGRSNEWDTRRRGPRAPYVSAAAGQAQAEAEAWQG